MEISKELLSEIKGVANFIATKPEITNPYEGLRDAVVNILEQLFEKECREVFTDVLKDENNRKELKELATIYQSVKKTNLIRLCSLVSAYPDAAEFIEDNPNQLFGIYNTISHLIDEMEPKPVEEVEAKFPEETPQEA